MLSDILASYRVFFFWLFTVPGENNVKCLEGFSSKPRNLLALSTASGKSVKKMLKGAVAVSGHLPSSEIF